MVTMQNDTKTIKVKAISADHAIRIGGALAGLPTAMVKNAHILRQPRPAKTCTTNDFPVKGTRKWLTLYEVYAYGNKVPVGRNKYEYTNTELVKDGIETKTEAVKIAREMAVKHQLPMTVKIVKVLEEDSPHVTDVEPKSTPGEYQLDFL